jgi:hypothetical protein
MVAAGGYDVAVRPNCRSHSQDYKLSWNPRIQTDITSHDRTSDPPSFTDNLHLFRQIG